MTIAIVAIIVVLWLVLDKADAKAVTPKQGETPRQAAEGGATGCATGLALAVIAFALFGAFLVWIGTEPSAGPVSIGPVEPGSPTETLIHMVTGN